jgi:hypothetical protein
MSFRGPLTLFWLMLAACGDGGGPSGRISVTLVSGGGQTAVVGHELTDPLVVEVTDASGNPVGGQLVNFVVTSGEGHMFAGAAETDAAGHARDFFTLGISTADPHRVEVRAVDPATGEKKTFGVFEATALSDVPVMALPYGVPIAAAGQTVPRRMGAIAYDQYNNPAAGAAVTFTVLEGGGSITGASQVTGTDGIASVGSWTFGPRARSGSASPPSRPSRCPSPSWSAARIRRRVGRSPSSPATGRPARRARCCRSPSSWRWSIRIRRPSSTFTTSRSP